MARLAEGAARDERARRRKREEEEALTAKMVEHSKVRGATRAVCFVLQAVNSPFHQPMVRLIQCLPLGAVQRYFFVTLVYHFL